ncbi:acyl-CoA thioesterase [Sphingoaurantiacus capsulatus]|uniref:Acyl-CoA thioesterase n=1 Tax=Sphingoaurantiacus capsulatus TaxID=1771310 RepID=A0ABV7XCC8_9SPHN
MPAFVQEKLIRFQHCDPAGLIFYPKAFELGGEVIEDWFTCFAGRTPHAFHAVEHKSLPTVKTTCEFFGQIHVSDLLSYELVVEEIGQSSVNVAITASKDGQPRYRMSSTLVQVGRKSDGRYGALAFADDMREALERYRRQPAEASGEGA